MNSNESLNGLIPSTEDLKELQQKLAYDFLDNSLLIQALTHKSFSNEYSHSLFQHNERMEFLGDAVLQFVISGILVEEYPALSEGQLSKFRSVLVSENGLAEMAEEINLGKFLIMGKGEIITGGRQKKSILADTMEAIIAAIYLDSKKIDNSARISVVIKQFFQKAIEKAEKTFSLTDNKSDLQEIVQREKLGTLVYKLIEESGPDHDKQFLSAVLINEIEFGRGKGKSKKISEQIAAVEALKKLKENYGDQVTKIHC